MILQTHALQVLRVFYFRLVRCVVTISDDFQSMGFFEAVI